MILSDVDIKAFLDQGRIRIVPRPGDGQYSPSALDLCLNSKSLRKWRTFPEGTELVVDPASGNLPDILSEFCDPVRLLDDDSYVLRPSEFVLGTTTETVTLPRTSRIAARVVV